jgi:hypothetical protein
VVPGNRVIAHGQIAHRIAGLVQSQEHLDRSAGVGAKAVQLVLPGEALGQMLRGGMIRELDLDARGLNGWVSPEIGA